MDDLAKRWRALDDLRGLAVLVMIPVNALMDFSAVPAWMRHAPGAGLTLADCVLPVFLFAMGVSASSSLRRRVSERGAARTVLHGLVRYGLLFAGGTVGYFLVWRQANWEVLQLLGLAGAIAFVLMFLPVAWRVLAAFLLVAGVEAARPVFFQAQFQAWYASGIGGPWGCLPFAAIPLAASALGEALRGGGAERRIYLSQGIGILSLAAGLVWSLAVAPPDKHLVSTAYLLVSFGLSCLLLALFSGLESWLSWPPLTALGRNPLLMYLLSGLIILPVRAWVEPAVPAWQAWAWGLGVLAVCAGAAWFMDRRGWRLKL